MADNRRNTDQGKALKLTKAQRLMLVTASLDGFLVINRRHNRVRNELIDKGYLVFSYGKGANIGSACQCEITPAGRAALSALSNEVEMDDAITNCPDCGNFLWDESARQYLLHCGKCGWATPSTAPELNDETLSPESAEFFADLTARGYTPVAPMTSESGRYTAPEQPVVLKPSGYWYYKLSPASLVYGPFSSKDEASADCRKRHAIELSEDSPWPRWIQTNYLLDRADEHVDTTFKPSGELPDGVTVERDTRGVTIWHNGDTLFSVHLAYGQVGGPLAIITDLVAFCNANARAYHAALGVAIEQAEALAKEAK